MVCHPLELANGTDLVQVHLDMFDIGNRYKHSLPSNSRFRNNSLDMLTPKNYMVVKVVPYNLFSDDTSSNSTAKWNRYYAWSLNVAAVPLSMANHYLNHLLICGSNKLDTMIQLPPLVPDLQNSNKD